MIPDFIRKLRFAFLAALAAALPAAALECENLDAEHWISGPKLTASSLKGKVVLVDYWGRGCGPCRAALPRVEQLWQAWNDRKFIVVGAHCQARDDAAVNAILEAAGVTYPVYQDIKIEGTPPFNAIPFICVFSPRGKLVYSGHSVPEATEAVVNELTEMGGVRRLLPTVELKKYKTLKAQLVFGKNVESVMRKLKADVAAGAKTSNRIVKEKAEEARAILQGLKSTYEKLLEDIEWELSDDPAAALRDYILLTSTWPSAKARADEKWGERIKEISADPEFKKEAKAYLDELKKAR